MYRGTAAQVTLSLVPNHLVRFLGLQSVMQWQWRVSGSGVIIGKGLVKPKGPQYEALRAEVGMGFLGRGPPALPHHYQLGDLGSTASFPVCLGQSRGHLVVFL